MRHFCFLHNVTRHPNGGLSSYEQRFGAAFNGPLLAFGSEVSYKSAVSEPNGPGNKFGPSSKQGVVVGYFVNPGGVWSKDYIVFDLEAVRDNKDCRRIRTRRCGEVFQKRGPPNFPMLTMEVQGNLVPPEPAVPKPEVLKFEATATPGQDPAEAESERLRKEAHQKELMEAAAKHGMPPIISRPLPDIQPLPPYKAGQFVDQASYDESRVPKGHKYEDGRITRANRTDSKRPPDMWPEMWAILTPEEKQEAIRLAAEVAQAAVPGLVAVSTMRHKTKTGLNKMPFMPTMSPDSKWIHREKCGDETGSAAWPSWHDPSNQRS